MKKYAVALSTLSFLVAGPAISADMRAPAYKAPAPVAPIATYNWTGCYVGAGGGYGMWNQRTQLVADNGVPYGTSNDNGGRGWFGTVQVGCDYQVGSNIVIGAFGDYDFSGIKGDIVPAAFRGGTLVGEEKLKSSWAAGGRIGWLPFNQLLVYVSGGYTQSKFGQVSFNNISVGGAPQALLDKHTYSGWFLGTGYEYGLGWMPGLFWKTEYRFADLSSDNVALLFADGAPTGFHLDSRKYVHTVRSEIVWRFNFGGPVVARY